MDNFTHRFKELGETGKEFSRIMYLNPTVQKLRVLNAADEHNILQFCYLFHLFSITLL